MPSQSDVGALEGPRVTNFPNLFFFCLFAMMQKRLSQSRQMFQFKSPFNDDDDYIICPLRCVLGWKKKPFKNSFKNVYIGVMGLILLI